MSLLISPGATLGVLGGGQLGRFWVQEAQRMGYRTVVLDPDPESPAGLVAHEHRCADYLDATAIAALAQSCAAVTTEFENVPAQALAQLALHTRLAPVAHSVAVCQDRVLEKAQFAACGVPCVPYAVLSELPDLSSLPDSLFPGVLKTAVLGYDGKGQRLVADRAMLMSAWDELGRVRCVLEQRVALHQEISVVLARQDNGAWVHLPPQSNVHKDGILAATVAGEGAVEPVLARDAVQSAGAIAQALAYVGVLCVEFFVLTDGRLLANEMAPRPHNSGHHSLDSCDLSQFALQLRTMIGAPLPPPRQHSAAVMLNLLGDLWQISPGQWREPDWARVLSQPGAHLHLYGKRSPRKGRKMGHLTFTATGLADAQAAAREAAAHLGVHLG